MATQTIENFNTLDLETLASVDGGKVDWGRVLSGASGAAEGVYYCASTGAPIFTIAPYALAGCGVVGAVAGYAFPH